MKSGCGMYSSIWQPLLRGKGNSTDSMNSVFWLIRVSEAFKLTVSPSFETVAASEIVSCPIPYAILPKLLERVDIWNPETGAPDNGLVIGPIRTEIYESLITTPSALAINGARKLSMSLCDSRFKKHSISTLVFGLTPLHLSSSRLYVIMGNGKLDSKFHLGIVIWIQSVSSNSSRVSKVTLRKVRGWPITWLVDSNETVLISWYLMAFATKPKFYRSNASPAASKEVN